MTNLALSKVYPFQYMNLNHLQICFSFGIMPLIDREMTRERDDRSPTELKSGILQVNDYEAVQIKSMLKWIRLVVNNLCRFQRPPNKPTACVVFSQIKLQYRTISCPFLKNILHIFM